MTSINIVVYLMLERTIGIAEKNKYTVLSSEHNGLTNRIHDLPLHVVYLYQITGTKLKSRFPM